MICCHKGWKTEYERLYVFTETLCQGQGVTHTLQSRWVSERKIQKISHHIHTSLFWYSGLNLKEIISAWFGLISLFFKFSIYFCLFIPTTPHTIFLCNQWGIYIATSSSHGIRGKFRCCLITLFLNFHHLI